MVALELGIKAMQRLQYEHHSEGSTSHHIKWRAWSLARPAISSLPRGRWMMSHNAILSGGFRRTLTVAARLCVGITLSYGGLTMTHQEGPQDASSDPREAAQVMLLGLLGAVGFRPTEGTRIGVFVDSLGKELTLDDAVARLAEAEKPLECNSEMHGGRVRLHCKHVAQANFVETTARLRHFVFEMLSDVAPATLPQSIIEVRSSAGRAFMTRSTLERVCDEYDLMSLAITVKEPDASAAASGVVAVLRFGQVMPIEWRPFRPTN